MRKEEEEGKDEEAQAEEEAKEDAIQEVTMFKSVTFKYLKDIIINMGD